MWICILCCTQQVTTRLAKTLFSSLHSLLPPYAAYPVHPKKLVASTGNPAQVTVTAGEVLNPGRYLIVPTSTGCVLNAMTATTVDETTFSPSSTMDSHGEQNAWLDCGKEAVFSAAMERALTDLFVSLDSDCDGVLSREEVRNSQSCILP